jgi:hypothetical protein
MDCLSFDVRTMETGAALTLPLANENPKLGTNVRLHIDHSLIIIIAKRSKKK